MGSILLEGLMLMAWGARSDAGSEELYIGPTGKHRQRASLVNTVLLKQVFAVDDVLSCIVDQRSNGV